MERPKTYVSNTMTTVPLKLIIDSEDIIYRPLDKEHVASLSRNIEANGLDQPLLVWNGDEKERGHQIELEDGSKAPATYLIAGSHRRAALRELLKRNKARYKELFPNGVPVYVSSGTAADVLSRQLRENVARKDMPASQVLPVVKKLMKEHGMKQREIAKAIGKHESYISQVLDAEETLGEDETQELMNEGAKLNDIRKAAKEVKEGKKKGKDNKKEVVEKTKAKIKSKKDSGRQRDEKRVSAKKIWSRYNALPKMNMGEKLSVLENALGYLAGDEEFQLPKELSVDAEKSSDEDDED
jgi:ParB-like chromosome segregation protein Spo0J